MAKREALSTLALHVRERTGTTASHASRHAGQVPGVLFGHGRPSIPIAVDARALSELLSAGGAHRIVEASLDGGHESVLLRDIQRHPVTHRPITADFQRVSLTEAIVASVSIVTRGVARGVKDFDGVMDIVSHQLEVRGPAGSLPEELVVDVAELGLGDHVTAGDVTLPPGFTLVTPRDAIVVSIGTTRAGASEGEGAAAEGAAETTAADTAPAATE